MNVTDEELENMKYEDVRKLSKELGLKLTNKKRDTIVDAIKKHYAQLKQEQLAKDAEKKVKEVQEEKVKAVKATKKTKKGKAKKSLSVSPVKKAKTPSPVKKMKTPSPVKQVNTKTPQIQIEINNESIITNDSSFNRQSIIETVKLNEDMKNNAKPMVGSTPVGVNTVKKSVMRKRSISVAPNMLSVTPKVKPLNETFEKKNENLSAINEVKSGPVIKRPVVNGVEIKQQTTGPRIVRPDDAAPPPPPAKQKIKPTKKPDFEQIHKKQMEKMESIDDNAKRVRNNQEQVENGRKMGKQRSASRLVAEKNKVVSPAKKIKENKTPVSNVVTGIPRLAPSKSNEEAPKTPKAKAVVETITRTPKAKPVIVTKTPKVKKVEITARTPKETMPIPKTPKGVTPLKKHFFSINNAVQNPNNGTLNMSNTQSNAFTRRKSFDINASLSRPLSYNPHIGRLKPLKFDSKSIYANKQNKQALNMNNTSMMNRMNGPDILHESHRFHSNIHTGKIRAKEMKIVQAKKVKRTDENRNITMDLSQSD